MLHSDPNKAVLWFRVDHRDSREIGGCKPRTGW